MIRVKLEFEKFSDSKVERIKCINILKMLKAQPLGRTLHWAKGHWSTMECNHLPKAL